MKKLKLLVFALMLLSPLAAVHAMRGGTTTLYCLPDCNCTTPGGCGCGGQLDIG